MTKGVNPVVSAHAGAYRNAFGRYTISSITFMEILRGYQTKLALSQVKAFLTAIAMEEVLPF